VETRIGCAVLQALVDIWPKLGGPKLLDIKHRDVRHGVFHGFYGAVKVLDQISG
jgi:hypothetical protein